MSALPLIQQRVARGIFADAGVTLLYVSTAQPQVTITTGGDIQFTLTTPLVLPDAANSRYEMAIYSMNYFNTANSANEFIFIYSTLSRAIQVGSTRVPLVQIVPASPTVSLVSPLQYEFLAPLMWVPVQPNPVINAFEFKFTNSSGQPFGDWQYTTRPIAMTLGFRKVGGTITS
jgi:hypothetical protein